VSRSRVAVVVAALGLAVPFVAGCGGGSGDSSSTTETTATTTTGESTAAAGDWANGFCGAFRDWANTLKPIGQSLQSNPTRDNLESAGDDIKDANDTLADDLKGLGKPEISGGDEAKSAVNTLADQIKEDSDTISNALTDISDASELVAAASTVSSTLLTLQSQVKNTLSQLKTINADNGSLKDAFNDASNCQALSS
jgi:hypothetical protein